MPIQLRSRRSRSYNNPATGVELQATPRRRSIRLQGISRVVIEESDESEPVPYRAMEKRQAEPEKEAAKEGDVTELKLCSVVLDRLEKDAEEKEDMSRKAGKLVSRIPTFQKRSAVGGQITDPPASRGETPLHAASEATGAAEESKRKPPEVKETVSVHTPRVGVGTAPVFSSEAQAALGAFSGSAHADWSLSESAQSPFLSVSARPALRPELLSSEAEAVGADASTGILPHDDSACPKQTSDTDQSPAASGDEERSPADVSPTRGDQVAAIMDEEPPWETEPMSTADIRDSRSSSDAEGDDKSDDSEHLQLPVSQSGAPNLSEKEASREESSVAAEFSSKRSRGSGFSAGLLLLLSLLLLGGLGHHVWRYGLPRSASELTAQLELHWLEGFGLKPEPCSVDCRVRLVESIPVGLYESSPSTWPSIADSWLHLLHRAERSVQIAAFYFTLRGSGSADPSDSQGRHVFEQLKQLRSRGVELQIAVNAPQASSQDTAELASTGAEVREVNLTALTGGIVHTKLWVVDQKHVYLGSANMDWRSLSQVKEVGLSLEDCSCLAQDASRIFGVYWSVGGVNASLPPYWPARLSALSSSEQPLHLKLNGVPARIFLSSAPPQISARGRSDDLAAILSVIHDAQEFVYISVMDFLPLSQFTEPVRFWPAIDSALRAAGCTRGVRVRLLVSCWEHSPASMFPFLQSLLVLGRPPLRCSLDVKIFRVPSTAEQMKIPFARVNHAKFMVTDRVVYIGTSNWSENYFTHTAGVGVVVNQTGSTVEDGQQTLQSQAEELFLRDWSSEYAAALSVDDHNVCPK
ncbi:phospholipase D3-like isoform X1 [Oryzias latipes]|uniref:Phospholipase D family, member 7 n=1 Tax=Oryzias latipes TaxID=8090 RepID=A0A3B3IHP1_ORYLA|nr:phospholipase D3-like isoform X1 [Oryzias latipes]